VLLYIYIYIYTYIQYYYSLTRCVLLLLFFQMGVVRALLEQKLLPRVISGNSGGSIVAGLSPLILTLLVDLVYMCVCLCTYILYIFVYINP